MSENNETPPNGEPDTVATTHRKTETVTTVATGTNSVPPKLWIDTEAKQQFVEKLLLMAASAAVSFGVATWYASRTLGVIDTINETQNMRITRLESVDMTAGAREQFAALKAHMLADDAEHLVFNATMLRITGDIQVMQQMISTNTQRLTELERQSERRQRQPER